MDGLVIILALAVVGYVIWNLFRSRARRLEKAEAAKTAPAAGLAVSRDILEVESGNRAPVGSFHVHGAEAQVTFDVPLPEEDDPVLNDLLVGEAVEVVREKRHTLPIGEVTQIVVFAGKDQQREIGRAKLPSPGELPPPLAPERLSFTHIARDPFAQPFDKETDESVSIETRADVPADELGPIIDELRIPAGLERGLRATGVDPRELSAHDLVLALLRMFGYSVTEQALPGTYLAVKDGVSTYIRTEPHNPGEHPELEESALRRFVGEFNSSGAQRGILVSGKYCPFMAFEIEKKQPKIRFITRERLQGFIDSMALG